MSTRPHHGHYLAFLDRYTPDQVKAVVEATPESEGVMVRFDWNALEVGPRRYDFSTLLQWLDWCALRGKLLIPMFEDKSFGGRPNPVPTHLQQHTAKNRTDGWSAIRWNPTIVEEYSRLLERASRYAAHPAWEGVLMMETAPSLDTAVLTATNYTPESYAAACHEVISRTNGRVFWQANFIPPRNESLISEVMLRFSGGVHVGGPDCLPNNKPLQDRAYPQWRQFDENFVGMSLPTYSVEGMTIEEVARYGIENLKARWLIWTYADEFTRQRAAMRALPIPE